MILRVSIIVLIRSIAEVSGSNSFGVSRLDVEEIFESVHEFIEYTLATVATVLLFLEFGFSFCNSGRI